MTCNIDQQPSLPVIQFLLHRGSYTINLRHAYDVIKVYAEINIDTLLRRVDGQMNEKGFVLFYVDNKSMGNPSVY